MFPVSNHTERDSEIASCTQLQNLHVLHGSHLPINQSQKKCHEDLGPEGVP